MQRKSETLTTHSFIAAFLQELAARDNSFKTLLEKSIREIVREEIKNQLTSTVDNSNSLKSYLVPDYSFTDPFLPFPKWKRGHDLYIKLLSHLVAAKFVAKSKNNPNILLTVKNLNDEGAIVWFQSIPKLIYIVHHLIHTYDAVAVSENLKKSLWENILFTTSNSKIPKHANFKSFLTLWSRIEKEIFQKQRVHSEIDDLLYDVFNDKEFNKSLK